MKNILLGSVFAALASPAQAISTDFDSLLPPGKIVAQKRFTDSLGDHAVVITETGVYDATPQPGEYSDGNRSVDLHAVALLQTPQGWKVEWRLKDFVHDCDVDLDAHYLPGSLYISDLDQNGLSEVSFAYTLLECTGDVSPYALKFILREGDQKFAIRGHTQIPPHISPYAQGGDTHFDASWKTAPPAFGEYARRVWQYWMKKTRFKG